MTLKEYIERLKALNNAEDLDVYLYYDGSLTAPEEVFLPGGPFPRIEETYKGRVVILAEVG